MPERSVVFSVDGRPVTAEEGQTVAVALLQAGVWAFRRSVRGEARGPICGMGVCFECRVTLDGIAGRRACLEPVRAGLSVETHTDMGAGAPR